MKDQTIESRMGSVYFGLKSKENSLSSFHLFKFSCTMTALFVLGHFGNAQVRLQGPTLESKFAHQNLFLTVKHLIKNKGEKMQETEPTHMQGKHFRKIETIPATFLHKPIGVFLFVPKL